MPGPFDLNDARAYAAWREQKLDTAPRRIEDIIVTLGGKNVAPQPSEGLILADPLVAMIKVALERQSERNESA